MPNQLNSDEAANDEPKTYNDEAVGEEDGWQGSTELDNLKGDLVDEVDSDPRRQSYDDKVSSQHDHGESVRNKEDLDRDSQNESSSGRRNFPYAPDLGSIVPGLNPHLFPNVVLTSSAQVPYSPYVPYHSLLYGTPSPSELDGKPGIPRHSHADIPSMYPLPGQLGQIPNPLAPPWSPNPLYNPLCTASAMAGMLRYPYPFGNFTPSSGTMASVSPFTLGHNPHAGAMHHSVISHPGMSLPGPMANGQGHSKIIGDKKNVNSDSTPSKRSQKDDKPSRPYVKKPLNAFMLYMKEQRAKVVAECTLKESAAINQILGRKWHSLNRDEQQKYYEMARKERQVHMQMFPGWSARDNYGKRKKRKKEKTQDCTASSIYANITSHQVTQLGVYHQQTRYPEQRRKKKCIRYQHDGDDSDLEDSDSSPQPHHYEGSPDSSYGQSGTNQLQTSTFSSNEQSVSSQSSSTAANNSGSTGSAVTALADRLSPGHNNFVEQQIKLERSPPMPSDKPPMSHVSSSRNGDLFQPQIPRLPTSSSESSFPFDSSDGNIAKRARSSDISNPQPQVCKNFHDSQPVPSRLPPNHLPGSSTKRDGDQHRNRRSNSHAEQKHSSQNIFNHTSMLSPTSMSLNPPHPPQASNFLSQFQPYLQMSTLAAAANLPSSPLSSLMGFPGFKGLSSPMGVSLNGTGSPVNPGAHPGSNSSRRTASVVEGKS